MHPVSRFASQGWTAFRESELARASAILLFIRVANAASAICLSIILIRTLGLQAYGAYAIYMAVFSLAVLPLTSGMPNFIVKEVAPMFVEQNRSGINQVVAFFLRLTGIYVTALGVLVVGAWLLGIGEAYHAVGALMWVHVVFQLLNAGRSALLRAIGRIVKGQLVERLIQPALTLVLTAAAWVALGEAFSVTVALIALVSSAFISFLIGAYWLRRELGKMPMRNHQVVPQDDWIRSITNLSGVGFLNSAFSNGVVLLIGWIGTLEAAALFRVAAAVALLLNYFQEVMFQVVAPRVAQLWRANDQVQLARVLTVGAAANSGVMAMGTMGLVVGGDEILALAYGSDARAAYTSLIVLSVANFAYALGGYRDLLLNMSGHASASFKVSLVLTPVALALAAFAIHQFAQTGAALAVLCFQFAASALYAVVTRKITGHDPSILSYFRPGPWRTGGADRADQ
jgi:O-antigen/teichoic acid export membrane protein